MDMRVKLTLTEELLGTASANPEIYSEHVAGGHPNAGAETETLPPEEEIAKGTTVFHRTADGKPMIYDYQIKGFFKDACGALARAADTESGKLTSYKKVIDGLVFVAPRQIVLELPAGAEIGFCERPLRANTAQGERIALARSETVPAGTTFTIRITAYDLAKKKAKGGEDGEPNKANLQDCIEEWLDYGKLKGLGAWRNSGKGRFGWCELVAEK